MLLVVSPTIISVVEKNFDISMLYNLNEEENQNEISETLDLKFEESKTTWSIFYSINKPNLFKGISKKYTSISIENTYPPPEVL